MGLGTGIEKISRSCPHCSFSLTNWLLTITYHHADNDTTSLRKRKTKIKVLVQLFDHSGLADQITKLLVEYNER